jgi:hypothetical protein
LTSPPSGEVGKKIKEMFEGEKGRETGQKLRQNKGERSGMNKMSV